MNRAYKIIWNASRQVWVAVGEFVKAHGKSKSQASSPASGKAVRALSALFLTAGLAVSGDVLAYVNWANVGTAYWSDGANWSGGTVPTGSDIVRINNNGTAVVNDTGNATNSIYVGYDTTGQLKIFDGGALSSAYAHIGSISGGNGQVAVQGTTATWTLSGNLYVGNSGSGYLIIGSDYDDAGTVSNATGYIGGFGSGSTGTVNVLGANATWSNSGDLHVGYFGTGTLNLKNTGQVNVNSGAGTVYIANTSGSSGTLNIGAAQGDAAVAAGTLNAAAVVFGAGTGKLVFNHTNTGYLFSPAVSGAGSVYIDAGTTIFTGNNTYTGGTTISSGSTLQIGNGGTTGSISGDITNNAALKFNRSDAVTFAGAISGSGDVNLIGTGTTRFTGDVGGFSGTLNVNNGTLSIAAGSALNLGTASQPANYTQTADAILQIGATSSLHYGQLAVSGTATLAADANIDINVAELNELAIGQTLSKVISAGTLEASTFTLTDNSTLFNFEAVVNNSMGTVDLNIVKAANIVDSVTVTNFGSGLGAAQVLDTITGGDVVISADMADVVTAFGKLEGDEAISQAVADTMPIFVAGTATISTNNMHLTTGAVTTRSSAIASTTKSGASSGDIVLADKHMWIKPVGNWTTQDQRNGVSGYKVDSYGFVGGIDGDLSESTKLGFAVSYMNTSVKGKDSASGNRADIDAYQAIVYGSRALASNMELNWQADVGLNKNEGSHYISFMNRTAQSDYDSYTAHVGAGIGKSIQLNDKTTVVPGIRADYAWIKDQSYSETGAGALNLNVDSNTSDELILTVQSSLSHELNDKTSFIADVGLGYDLLNEQASLTASYSGGGASFTTPGIDPSPWIGSAGAGINYNISDTSEITARYDVEGRSDFLSQTASVKFSWMF